MSESKYKLNTIRHWYITTKVFDDGKYYFVHGQFFNRPGFYEGKMGRTSLIKSIVLNEEEKEYQIQTNNTFYHCPFDSLLFEFQDGSEYQLPEYERIKKEYYVPKARANLGKNDMLLVIADYQEYYFDSLVYQNADGTDGEYSGFPHIGMFTDSYLISNEEYSDEQKDLLDIRYYVCNSGIEFYSKNTAGKNLWIENRGETSLYIDDVDRLLQPGQRIIYKEVK